MQLIFPETHYPSEAQQLYVTPAEHSGTVHFAYTVHLCVLYDAHEKCQLLSQGLLTVWLL